MAIAAVAPVKGQDQPIPLALSSATLTLAQLSSELPTQEPASDTTRSSLSSARPSWRELAAAVASQSSWQLDYFGCGNSTSLLFGNEPRERPWLYERRR